MKPALVDTDIVSYFLRGNGKVFINFQEYLRNHEFITISIITYYEVLSGLNFKNAVNQLEVFERFCKNVRILNLSEESIKISARIYSEQRKSGQVVDDIDILIAGIALANGLVLVTNNVRHFGKIVDLTVENWNE